MSLSETTFSRGRRGIGDSGPQYKADGFECISNNS
jgi:hypothetical protein